MKTSLTKLDQALSDLIEAYSELEDTLLEKYDEDEEAFNNAIVEVLETSLENAIDEQDSTTTAAANMLTALFESLESLDPSAFEDEEADEFEVENVKYTGEEEDDIDLDEDEEDLIEDEDEDDD